MGERLGGRALNSTNGKTKFQTYLSHLGDNEASKVLDLSIRAVKAYRLGERAPRITDIPNIVSAADGSLSYACFFESAGHE